MERIKSIIVEDEPNNRENLRVLLENYCPQVEVVSEAANVGEGLKEIWQHRPELVFLDVQMPDGTGFDLLSQIPSIDFKVIFVTAYSHYAIQAIRFNAMDYILKPIDISELCGAVDKVTRKQENDASYDRLQNLLSNLKVVDPQAKRIPLASSEALRMVELKQIIRLQGENNYTRFYLSDGTAILVSKTLKEYDQMLENSGFMRVHQSHLVNLQYINSYVKSEGGYLLMQDGSQVTVSRNRKQALLDRLQEG